LAWARAARDDERVDGGPDGCGSSRGLRVCLSVGGEAQAHRGRLAGADRRPVVVGTPMAFRRGFTCPQLSEKQDVLFQEIPVDGGDRHTSVPL